MISSCKILFLLIIFISDLANFATSFNTEGINGGYPAKSDQFTYQAGILIPEPNDVYPYTLICSGSFIAKNIVLSIAQCFVHDDGTFIEYTYSITCCTLNWKFQPGTTVLVKKIYFPSGGSYHYLNNVAVAKLMSSIRDPRLTTVEVPLDTNIFYGTLGEVSGYGFSWVMMSWNPNHTDVRFNAGTEYFLQYGVVIIAKQTKCKYGNEQLNPERHLCGQMAAGVGYDKSGICDGDDGSPLVSGDMAVVGLAGPHRIDCDDSREWGIGYTKVSYFAEFINSILNRNPLPDLLIHYNILPDS